MNMRMLKTPANSGQKPDPELDLDDPDVNFNAMLKIRGDIAEQDFFFACAAAQHFSDFTNDLECNHVSILH